VVRKAGEIGRLVDDLLFLARSDAGAINVQLDDVVLQDVIADVLLDSQGLSRRGGITISPRQSAEPIRVRGDAGRLRQALLIALDNAIKFAPTGSTVEIDLQRRAGRALVTVRDFGPGFTPDEQASAFERFYRGRAPGGRSGRGAGLGLAIARWIMDKHNGTIEIASAPGKGAAVEIGLPLEKGESA
jgi:signal transduction histidine kinase